jgi:peptidoglycan L-alanyl-D-glutamate endopeptidase CwlK
MPRLSEQSKAKLATCDLRLQDILKEVIKSIDFIVLEGHRGQMAQNAAVKNGTSKLPWPKGKHNSMPSRAVDIAPYLPDVKIDWKDLAAFARLMGYVQRVAEEQGVKLRFGLDWDGDFRTRDENFVDAPHIELVDP